MITLQLLFSHNPLRNHLFHCSCSNIDRETHLFSLLFLLLHLITITIIINTSATKRPAQPEHRTHQPARLQETIIFIVLLFLLLTMIIIIAIIIITIIIITATCCSLSTEHMSLLVFKRLSIPCRSFLMLGRTYHHQCVKIYTKKHVYTTNPNPPKKTKSTPPPKKILRRPPPLPSQPPLQPQCLALAHLGS